jgi:hypothetical protein
MESITQVPELYSPLAMILAGIAGLAFLKALRWGLSRSQIQDSERGWIEAAAARFEARGRLSWVLILFGLVWTLQLIAQESWAGGQ